MGHRTNEQFITGISTAGGLPCQDGLWGGHWGHQGFFFGKQDTDIREAFARKFLPGSTQELDEFAHLQRVLPRTVGVRLLENDVWVMNMNSGGGYGDPIKRPPALVLDDFHEGFVGAELARRVYGVILNDSVIDEVATGGEASGNPQGALGARGPAADFGPLAARSGTVRRDPSFPGRGRAQGGNHR